MPELIDRQSSLSVCKEYGWIDDEDFIEGYNTAIKDIREAIKELPTVEAKPVRHGRWIFGSSKTSCWMTCSICCKSQSGQTATFSYCPNCGAEMDGGADNG